MTITNVSVQYAYDLSGGGVHRNEVVFAVTMGNGYVCFYYKKVGWLLAWIAVTFLG